MNLLSRLFGGQRERETLRPLYQAVVSAGRAPTWYRDGGVPDTLEGRFEMVAAVLALVLLRLEAEGARAQRESVLLTEIFIDDMDGTLRQLGIGDFVVGKHVGKLIGALGGRIGAFREALRGEMELELAVRGNVFRDGPVTDAEARFVTSRLRALHEALAATALEPLLAGEFPEP